MNNNWKVKVSQEDKVVKYKNIEYHIDQIIGSGASAKVYQSQKFIDQIKQQEDVAVRIQHRYYKQNYDLLNQLKDFKWKNTTYPIENIPGGFLFTEYELFNGNLTQLSIELIKENIFIIAQTIAEALIEIHQSNYIHFDVKPDNIVFKKILQNKLKFALCDFSSIQPLDNAGDKELFIEATPQFAPPEIEIQGYSKNIDHTCDIWSLGMSLYSLYSEKFMFQQDNLHLKMEQEFIDMAVDQDIDNDQLRYLIKQLLKVQKEERISLKEMIEFIQNPEIKKRQPQTSTYVKQCSYNSNFSSKQAVDQKEAKVKQPNLLKFPTLSDIFEASKKLLSNSNNLENNNGVTHKRQKQSCLLEMPNLIF
ncbi:unnamed protein product (macronuclear) [Paramecium tetraurelia]|uniref:Protein kinase domain-containing protein n=1 Tax=Paramecium tetraurelia TaxID=5888 RepID=A0CSI3_PARTE|nr:uncharacterized protein GSPATT00010022001 [Paramecium tetraurelia]CAK73750.1 unnamed protein product [Paramecium tetraurelia]|eukprot:XP_001441147.1 hypothetical protein (macronuclear) [Paramecium tetraurelia strain d4-2]